MKIKDNCGWHDQRGYRNPIRRSSEGRVAVVRTIFQKSTNLQSQGAAKCAGQVSRPNRLSGFQSEASQVLEAVAFVPETSWGVGSPRGRLSEVPFYGEGVPSFNICDCPQAHLNDGERVVQNQDFTFDFRTGQDVEHPHPTHSRHNAKEGAEIWSGQIVNQGMGYPCSRNNKGDSSSDVAGSRSILHPEIVSCKELING